MTSPRPRTRRLRAATGLAVAGIAAALTLTGCSATNPMTTENEYDSSDGVSAEIGQVKALNFLVASKAKGEPGALLGALQNTSAKDQTVTITLGTDDQTVGVPAGQTVLLDAPGGNTDTNVEVVFESIPEPPGAVVTVTVATTDAGSVELDVPILDGSDYASSVPTPSPSSTS
ncbi:hypothetical protein [Cellulomonas sp. URHD0024]|uniref:hypothetical protein n=1 Tax=Cellulomonas sp. URHD0024 TaxID=1302620 RepID=UPI0003F9F8F8|nr:hypothetical protein [Cellulomonas sp. URHD0024]